MTRKSCTDGHKTALTHLAIVFSGTPCTYKIIEPGLHPTAHDRVKTLVRCLVSSEEIQNVKLGRQGD